MYPYFIFINIMFTIIWDRLRSSFFLVSDEEVVVGSALKMLQLKSLIPILNPSEMKF